MKTVAIVQARMSSTRLMGKVLLDVLGRPLLFRVFERIQPAKNIDEIVVATSDRTEDQPIADFCAEYGFSCFRGSHNDVLDRFMQGAALHRADVIVRLTADCPLLDPQVIQKIVSEYREGDFDFVSNTLERTYPDGLDTEVFSFDALKQAHRESKKPSEREHVTPFIYNHPERFRLKNIKNEKNLSAYRWTVDEPRDLAFVRAVYAYMGDRLFGMDDVIRLLTEHPELSTINAGIGCNEGYKQSLLIDALR